MLYASTYSIFSSSKDDSGYRYGKQVDTLAEGIIQDWHRKTPVWDILHARKNEVDEMTISPTRRWLAAVYRKKKSVDHYEETREERSDRCN